jgi:two-component system, NarL family, nitrate/nitrite response regulator NarL
MQPIKIIIADDHALFAHGISVLLTSDRNFEILDIVNDGKELLDVLQKIQPDIILLDINMPKLNGLEAARKIRMHYSSMKIIMLSTYNDEHLIQKAIEYNVQGYLVKTTDKEELIFCINEIMKGKKYFPGIIKKKEENRFNQQDSFLKQFNLTKREFEILQLIKQAFTNQQISEILFLSIYTVETHRKNIMHKLGLNSPAGLMKFISEKNI